MHGVNVQDHPVLNRPCFMLHPCQTAALLELMLPSMSGSRTKFADTHPPAVGLHDSGANAAQLTTRLLCSDDSRASCEAHAEQNSPPIATCNAAAWQLRYMLAWWSVVGSVVKLALPAVLYV